MRPYPQYPGFKEKGGCSEEAAQSLARSGRSAKLQRDCLTVLKANPFGRTANEIAGILKEEVTSIRPRVSELKELGLIEKHGTRRMHNTQGDYYTCMAVWRLTDAGKAAECGFS